MGPEPFILPLVVIGVIGLCALIVRMVKRRFMSIATPTLVGALVFALWGAQGMKTWEHYFTVFLMAVPVGIVVCAVPAKLLAVTYVWLHKRLVLKDNA